MPEYLTPGVYFEPRDQAPVVRGLRTDIAGFVGLAESGPLNAPQRIESWRQFQAVFGGFVSYGYLAYAVKAFFENGGRTSYIVRVAGPSAERAGLMLKSHSGLDVIRVCARNEGAWGNRLALSITQVRPSKSAFTLKITRSGADFELFRDLSLDPQHERYFARLLNEGTDSLASSRWVEVEDKIGFQPRSAALLPDPAKSGFQNGTALLAGGVDDLASVRKEDFLGRLDLLALEKRGLSALDEVDAVAIVCMPDMHIRPVLSPRVPPPIEPLTDPCCPKCSSVSPVPLDQTDIEPPAGFSDEDIAVMQREMIERCERLKDRIAILDAPQKPGGRALTVGDVQEWRDRLESPRGYGALYYPWVKVVDPARIANAALRVVPPCGHVAGLYARTDLVTGVHKAPANGQLFWAEDVTAHIDDAVQGVLNPQGINCLRAFPGRGIRVYGARTVSSDPDWRYVNVRRLLMMIEEAVDEATQWAVFEPHDLRLRQLLIVSISGFLEKLWRQGALVGSAPEKAFYVKCDEVTNPPEAVDAGRIVTEVGVAPTIPAEFIIFRIGRTREELELVEV